MEDEFKKPYEFPVDILGDQPKNKTRCINVVSAYLNLLPFGELKIDPVLLWCFKNHPRYDEKCQGLDVIGFEKIHNFATYALFVLLSDNNKIDFTYKKGIEEFYKGMPIQRQSKKANDLAKKVKGAFRKTIRYHMVNWSSTNQNSYSKGDVVDHVFPDTFEAIFSNFMTENSLAYHDIELNEGDFSDSFGYVLSNQELKNKWIDYHNARAKYRWLSAKLNMSYGCRNPLLCNGSIAKLARKSG